MVSNHAGIPRETNNIPSIADFEFGYKMKGKNNLSDATLLGK